MWATCEVGFVQRFRPRSSLAQHKKYQGSHHTRPSHPTHPPWPASGVHRKTSADSDSYIVYPNKWTRSGDTFSFAHIPRVSRSTRKLLPSACRVSCRNRPPGARDACRQPTSGPESNLPGPWFPSCLNPTASPCWAKTLGWHTQEPSIKAISFWDPAVLALERGGFLSQPGQTRIEDGIQQEHVSNLLPREPFLGGFPCPWTNFHVQRPC